MHAPRFPTFSRAKKPFDVFFPSIRDRSMPGPERSMKRRDYLHERDFAFLGNRVQFSFFWLAMGPKIFCYYSLHIDIYFIKCFLDIS